MEALELRRKEVDREVQRAAAERKLVDAEIMNEERYVPYDLSQLTASRKQTLNLLYERRKKADCEYQRAEAERKRVAAECTEKINKEQRELWAREHEEWLQECAERTRKEEEVKKKWLADYEWKNRRELYYLRYQAEEDKELMLREYLEMRNREVFRGLHLRS